MNEERAEELVPKIRSEAWERLQALTQTGVSFAQLIDGLIGAVPAPPLPDDLLHRSALVRSIEPPVYEEILAAGVEAPSFEEFYNHAEVERAGPKSCALPEPLRKTHLAFWKEHPAELIRTSARLAEFYGRRKGFFDQFLHQLFAEPASARSLFLDRYKALDEAFALSGCEALLRLLRQRLLILPPDLLAALNDREQYLHSRTLFAEDHYRTVVHLIRKKPADDFEGFLDHPTEWVLRLHGAGGVGKTLFLRWLIAHRCIPERPGGRIPVARIDMDAFDRRGLGDFPLLAFLPLMKQLTQQLPDNPFASALLTLRDYEALVQRPSAREEEGFRQKLKARMTAQASLISDLPNWFAGALGSQRVLIILDTIEDMLLHQRSQLLIILQFLAGVRSQCPGLKLIVSGRYDLADAGRLPEFVESHPGQCGTVHITNFSESETREYLGQLRNIRKPGLIEAIWKKTKGHPLDLTLFGDIAVADSKLTPAQVRRLPPHYARLIERIIDRIPDEQSTLRWLLRYAVVPRRLDLDYIRRVINNPVARESQGKSVRDDTSRYPDQRTQQRYGPKERWHPLDQPHLEEAWDQLRSYAAQTSWVIEVGGVIQLQPEIVEPMRALLRVNPIYQELQRKSQSYFERLARERGQEWGQWMAEAVYHRFQRDLAGTGQYWIKQLRRARKRGFDDLERVAGVVFGPEFLDEKKRPRVDASRSSIARASFDLAYASVVKRLRMRSGDPDVLVSEAQLKQRWEDVCFYASGRVYKAVSKGKRSLIRAAVAAFNGSEKLLEKQRLRAIAQSEFASSRLSEDSYRLVAEMLLGARLHWPNLREARSHFLEAYRISKRTHSSDLPCALIDFLLAQCYLYFDDLQHAAFHLKRSWQRRDEPGVRNAVEPSEVYRRLAETLLKSGEWSEVARLERLAGAAAEQGPWMQFQRFHVQARLDLHTGDWESGLASCRKAAERAPDVQAQGALAETEAELEAARFKIEEATHLFQKAEAAYQQSGSLRGIPTCGLKTARMYLDRLGDATRAGAVLASLGEAMPTAELQIEYFSLRIRVLAQTDPRTASQTWRSNWEALEQQEYAVRARARFLVLGLAMGFAGPEVLRRLWPLLAAIRPRAAVYPVIAEFSLFSGSPWAGDSARSLIRYALRPNPKSVESALRVLAYASALQFFGRRASAARLLAKARPATANYPGLESRFCEAQFSADPARYESIPLPKSPAPGYQPACDPNRIRFLEEAERAWSQEKNQLAAGWLGLCRVEEWPTTLARSQWGIRAHLLSARLNDPSVREGRRHLLSAGDTAKEIGYRLPDWAETALNAIQNTTLSETELAPSSIHVTVKGKSDQGGELECSAPNGQLLGRTAFQVDNRAKALFVTTTLRAQLDREVGSFVGKDLPIRLTVPLGNLAGMPWENLLPQHVFVYRVPESGPRYSDTIRCIQRSLFQLGNKIVVDGVLGPETSTILRHFTREPKLPAPRELLELRPPEGCVVIVQPDIEQARSVKRGHGFAGIRAADLYAALRVRVVEHVYRDVSSLAQTIEEAQPAVVHFVTGFWQTRTDEIQLDLASPDAEPLSPRHLSSIFLTFKKTAPPPFAIVEAVTPPSDYDLARQGYLRNRFCAELFESGRLKGLLATGLWPRARTEEALRQLVRALNGRTSVGQLFLTSRYDQKWPPAQWSSALFCSDPYLPIWES